MNSSAEALHPPIRSLIPELDRLAAGLLDDWKVPGATLAVVQDGKVALTRAWGVRDVERDLPMTTATQFVICSITKSFTATAMALLHNEGRLDWTKPVRDDMPEFRLHDSVASDRITIRDLLSHHSGLPRHDWVHFAGDRAPAEMLGPMRYIEPSRDIRATWQYSNLGYNVAGLLIERISGQNFEAFIRARLTDRLGMKVGFSLEELEAEANAAQPYMMHEDARLPLLHRHYETFELPEVPDRLLPDRLAIVFLTDRDGNVVSLSTSLEPMVKDIVFARLASGECLDPAFRARCVGQYKGGATTYRVTLDDEGGLVLKPDYQPAYRLAPEQGRRFRIVELEGFVVEFRGEGTAVDEVMFHQPNGTFTAQRVEG